MALRILLSNGAEFEVVGRMTDKVPEPIARHKGWANFYLTDGRLLAVHAPDVIAVVEPEEDAN